jgi:hypothetical protein
LWRDFRPRADERLDASGDGRFVVHCGSSFEAFSVPLDETIEVFAWKFADRVQTILMEYRMELVPECPLHPGTHPLECRIDTGRARWFCPSTTLPVRSLLSGSV